VEREQCEATAAENLKLRAAMKAQFLEGKAKEIASAAPADAGTRASDEPALAGAAACAAPDTAVTQAQAAARAAEAPALPAQPQPQQQTAPFMQSTVFVLGRAVKRPAEDAGASGSGAKKQRTEQPAVSRVAPPVAVLHPQAQPTASSALAPPLAVVPDAASGNAVHQALDDAAAEPPAERVAAVDDSLQRGHLAACIAAREKAEQAYDTALRACPAMQTAGVAAREARGPVVAERERVDGLLAAAEAEHAAIRVAEASAAAKVATLAAMAQAARANEASHAAAAEAADNASARATAAVYKLRAAFRVAQRAEAAAADALNAMAV
jgi:hypothetical protein